MWKGTAVGPQELPNAKKSNLPNESINLPLDSDWVIMK